MRSYLEHFARHPMFQVCVTWNLRQTWDKLRKNPCAPSVTRTEIRDASAAQFVQNDKKSPNSDEMSIENLRRLCPWINIPIVFFSSSDTWDVIACISRPVSQLERLDLMSTTPFLFSIAGNAIFKRIQRFYWPDRQFYFLNYFGENRTILFYNCCQWYNSHFERIYIFYKIFKYIFT